MMIDDLKISLSNAENSMNMTKASFSREAEELRRRGDNIPELQNRIANLERQLMSISSENASLKKVIDSKDQ